MISRQGEPERTSTTSRIFRSQDSYRSGMRFARCDLMAAVERWPLILYLSWHDIRQRYRRSTLGPLWLTVSVAVQIAALGLVYGRLFHLDSATYLPYLATGLTVWALIAGMINDGCFCFIAAEAYLKQSALPKAIFPARVVLRSVICFGHDAVIVLVVLLVYSSPVGWGALLALLGLVILALNGLWIGLLMGILCTRFRDLPPIVASMLQVAFFITPVIWHPQSLAGQWSLLLRTNPFAIFLSLIRDPLLGTPVALSVWVVALAVTALGWFAAFVMFARFRARITYWL